MKESFATMHFSTFTKEGVSETVSLKIHSENSEVKRELNYLLSLEDAQRILNSIERVQNNEEQKHLRLVLSVDFQEDNVKELVLLISKVDDDVFVFGYHPSCPRYNFYEPIHKIESAIETRELILQ